MTCWCEEPEILATDCAVDECENCGDIVEISSSCKILKEKKNDY